MSVYLEILVFRRAKVLVKCTSSGHFIGQSTIGELLLVRKGQKFVEVMSLITDITYTGVCKIKKDRVTHFSHFIPENVQKLLRNSQPQFRENSRKLRLMQKSI